MLTAKLPRTGTTVKNTYTYSSGALASITDQLSHAITISTANGTGQPTKILDANSVETDFVYDNRNRLTSKTVKAGTNEVTTYSYIGSGQPHVVTLPDSSTITYAYDNAQRLTTTTNTAGETINYTLDAKGDITAYAVKDFRRHHKTILDRDLRCARRHAHPRRRRRRRADDHLYV